MKLDRAAIYLQADVEGAGFADTNTLNEAKLLGIEALKRCITLAKNNPLWAAKPLPGETKD